MKQAFGGSLVAAFLCIAGCGEKESADIAFDASPADAGIADSGAPPDASLDAGPQLPTWAQEEYLKASNTEAGDKFGGGVALSVDGNTLAIGVPSEDSAATLVGGDEASNAARDAGAVYVFVRSGGGWVQEAYIKAGDADFFDKFGTSISISSDGNTLAIGAEGEDSIATGVDGDALATGAFNSGAVYIFLRTDGTWAQDTYLKASNTNSSDFFGTAVSLSGDASTLAVGALGEDSATTGVGGDETDDSAPRAGAVYVFANDVGTWSQEAYLKASNTDAYDRFGSALSLSDDGNTLAVGAWGEDSVSTGLGGDETDNTGTRVGAAYLFSRDTAIWSPTSYLKASNAGSGDQFGDAVALSGDGLTLVVGASQESSAAKGVDGDQSSNSAVAAGAAYVFQFSAGAWSQSAYLKAHNTDAFDNFAHALAISDDGSLIVAGAISEGSMAAGADGDASDNSMINAGAGYLYQQVDDSWVHASYLKSSTPDANDRFGGAVAISGGGSTLVAGATGEASSALGIAGDESLNDALESGAASVFGIP